MDLQGFIEGLQHYGPLGLFLAAFISNLIPGFPAVYLTVIGAYAALKRDPGGDALLILAAGVGAGLGKVVVFYVSNLLAGRSERIRRKREEYAWLLRRGKLGIFLLVLLFASLPLPDDVLYIPLGISGFSTLWFTAGVIIGKTLMTLMVYALGSFYRDLIGGPEADMATAVAGLAAGTMIVTAAIFAIDWNRVYRALTEEGTRRAVIVFLDEVLGLLTLRPLRRKLSARPSP